MSTSSPTSADFTTCINSLRNHIGRGTQPSDLEMRLMLGCLKILNAFDEEDLIADVINAIADADADVHPEVTYSSNTTADGGGWL